MHASQGMTYKDAAFLAQEAFRLCLAGDIYTAQEFLLRIRNTLKRLSGDLPIIGYDTFFYGSNDTPFTTQSFEEAQAWGWLEIASGTFQLVENHPGTSMVYFKRAWRIWRPWGMATGKARDIEQVQARYERVRAGLWLGEAWARFMSDRAQSNAQAILRASLFELQRLGQIELLQETIGQQQCLPPALLGSPAYREDKPSVPYICTLHIPDPLSSSAAKETSDPTSEQQENEYK